MSKSNKPATRLGYIGQPLTRRSFLVGAAAATVGSSAVLAACSDDD